MWICLISYRDQRSKQDGFQLEPRTKLVVNDGYELVPVTEQIKIQPIWGPIGYSFKLNETFK